MNATATSQPTPLVSVVIVNYNCKAWIVRLLESMEQQTIFGQTEVIVVDNISKDGSDLMAEELLKKMPMGVFIQTGTNLGFGGGCNRGAEAARGKFIFFLNADLWLERDCLERLVEVAERNQQAVAGALILDYEDDSFQSRGIAGFDIFGLSVDARPKSSPKYFFSASAFYFIRSEIFWKIGGFDRKFFMYGEEMDLAWRVWISGEKVVAAPAGRVHHRGAAVVNPAGGTKKTELRTSDTKRFYANQSHLLTLLKNCQHLLLLLMIPAVLLVLLEGLAGAVLLRRWSFFLKTGWGALAGCWRLRHYVAEERRRIRSFRRRNDLQMLRFLSWRLNRWSEIRQMFKLGLPKVEQR